MYMPVFYIIFSLVASNMMYCANSSDNAQEDVNRPKTSYVGNIDATFGKKTRDEIDQKNAQKPIAIAGSNHVISINAHNSYIKSTEEEDGVRVFYPDLLKIGKANYGANGWWTNGYWDVTPFLQHRFDNKPSGSFKVDNQSFGGDPSKGHKKKLTVDYQCVRGELLSRVMSKSFDEGSEVFLTCKGNTDKKFD
jgi:hypothetical protein